MRAPGVDITPKGILHNKGLGKFSRDKEVQQCPLMGIAAGRRTVESLARKNTRQVRGSGDQLPGQCDFNRIAILVQDI